jgi:hypothetical protein
VTRKVFLILLALVLAFSVALVACGPAGEEEEEEEEPEEVTVYIGGGFPLTGPYPEDGQAVLDAFQHYAEWVNDNHKISPWGPSFPSHVVLEVKQMDDGASPVTSQTVYATLKGEGLKVYRISGSGIGSGMKAQLFSDQCGATSMASGAWVMTGGSGSIFTTYPLYTEQMAAVADWFMDNWEGTEAPRVAYLTNNTFGSTGSLIVTSLNNYLTGIGYDLVDTNPHYVTSGAAGAYDEGLALASLQWCVANEIDLTLGAMTAPPAESMINLANSLGIGVGQAYEMQIALSSPAHGTMVERDARDPAKWNDPHLADGLIVAGSYPAWDDTSNGVQFCRTLLNTYGGGFQDTEHIMYQHGVIEAMVQVEAIRLALINTGKSANALTSADIFTQGFLKITDLDTGGIIPGVINYSTGKVEGAQYVRIDKCWDGTTINIGSDFPIRPNLW